MKTMNKLLARWGFQPTRKLAARASGEYYWRKQAREAQQ